MARYMSRPVFVDAVRWMKFGDHPNVVLFGSIEENAAMEEADQPVLQTPIGLVAVSQGDWIVTDEHKNMFVIEQDDFSKQFEKVVYGS